MIRADAPGPVKKRIANPLDKTRRMSLRLLQTTHPNRKLIESLVHPIQLRPHLSADAPRRSQY